MNQLVLTVGDWSDDGHGKTSRFVFEHNLTQQGIKDAYRLGSEKLQIETVSLDIESYPSISYRSAGFSQDVMSLVAESYEDGTVPQHIAEALQTRGIYPSVFDAQLQSWVDGNDEDELYEKIDDEYFVQGPEGFANLWMRIAKLGNSSLDYTQVEPDNVNIGGYGLFN